METREADRWSSVLGLPCRIMQPLGTPKPREECQPFTFELYPLTDIPGPRAATGEQYPIRRLVAAQKAQESGKDAAKQGNTVVRLPGDSVQESSMTEADRTVYAQELLSWSHLLDTVPMSFADYLTYLMGQQEESAKFWGSFRGEVDARILTAW